MKLNLGSGDYPLPEADGWINLDAKYDDSLFPLQMGNIKPDGGVPNHSVDIVRASHCLEHFPLKDIPAVLAEWTRVLKPGGWLKIAVPDFAFIARTYLGEIECKSADGSPVPIASWLMGGQTDDLDYHKAIFDEASLRNLLTDAGLVNIQWWKSEIADCAALPVSLNLMGRKPRITDSAADEVWERFNVPVLELDKKAALAPIERWQVLAAGRWQDLFDGAQIDVASEQEAADYRADKLPKRCLESAKRQIRIAAAMSLPRIGYIDAFDGITTAFNQVCVARFMGYGVMWSHALSRSIKQAMEWTDANGFEADYICSADYDTFATPDQLITLADILARHPEVDAVVPVQAKRGGSLEILAGSDRTVDMTQEIAPIQTGHFGFTLFRRSFFERLEKPWFREAPDANGEWGEGRTDCDIGFWRNAQACGLNVALANRVVCGHGEETIAWPTIKDGIVGKIYQPVTDWLAQQEPPVGVAG